MDLGISNEVAIVTGGSRGIGRAVVEALLDEGVRVATGSRHVEEFEGLMHDADELMVEPLDVSNPESIGAFVSKVEHRWGHVDMVVNNAGRAIPGGFSQLTDEKWREDIDVKVMAQVRMTRHALQIMPDGGRIVNITAIVGKSPDPRYFASSVNRAACSSLTKALARELAVRNIRVNAASIGFIYSGQWMAKDEQFFHDRVREFDIPLGRFGEPKEAAAAVLFLLSHQASYLTGVILDVDGGMARYL